MHTHRVTFHRLASEGHYQVRLTIGHDDSFPIGTVQKESHDSWLQDWGTRTLWRTADWNGIRGPALTTRAKAGALLAERHLPRPA